MPEEGVKKIVRRRRVGVRDIYIAKITQNDENEYIAETPKKTARAIKVKITDKFTSEKTYSDDSVEEVFNSYEGSEIEIEVNTLAPQDKADFLGTLYKNGYLIYNKDDKAPEIAIGWREKKTDGKYNFIWYYCGAFGNGVDQTSETQEASVKTQTDTIKGEFYGRQKDGNFKIEVDESNLIDEYVTAKDAIKNWFGEVQEYKDNDVAG